MQATSSAAPPLPAELTTDSAALEQLRLLLTGGGVDLALRSGEQGEGFETRSGRISRKPHHPTFPARPSEEPKPSSSSSANGDCDTPQPKKTRGPGRPAIFTKEESAMRRRERNKEAAVQSRLKKKAKLDAADETAKQLEERKRECEALRERCAQLEARVNQLQAQIVGLGHTPAPPAYTEKVYQPPAPRPRTPPPAPTERRGPGRPPKSASTAAKALTPPRATPAETPMPPPPAPPAQTPMAPPSLPPMSEAEAAAAAAAVLSSGFNAAAFATPSAVAPSAFSTPGVLTPLTDAAMATHAQQTPASPVDLTGAYTGFEGGDDYDTMSLSALFNFDDLPEDAADEDFVPPTSPKPGESSSDDEDEDEDEEEEEEDDDSGKEPEKTQHRGQKRPREDDEEAGDEAEDMFLPIRDVPIPIEEVYSDAMAALGVNSKEELTKVVADIVKGASQGHVSAEAVEVLRRLVTIAEAQGLYARGSEPSSSR